MTAEPAMRADAGLDVGASVAQESSPEVAVRRAMVKSIAISVPAAIVTFVGLVALAFRGESPNWAGWLAMAAGVGVLAGVFFGALAGFIRSVPLFD